MKKLKLCPFCGNSEIKIRESRFEVWGWGGKKRGMYGWIEWAYSIECNMCSTHKYIPSSKKRSRARAVKAWNTRLDMRG